MLACHALAGRTAVCDRCKAIDRDLLAFERLTVTVNDTLALALLAEVVKDLHSERATLHANESNKRV